MVITQIDEAIAAYQQSLVDGAEARAMEPRAEAAHYDPIRRHVVVALNNGCTFSFPVALAQGLTQASDEDLAAITVLPGGTALCWDHLDADFLISGLLNGLLGTRAWMAEIAGRGGRAKTDAKAAAARLNGKKGGRPRKAAAVA